MKGEAWRLWRIEEIFLSRKGKKQIKAAWLLKSDPWPVDGEMSKCAMQWHGIGSYWAQAEASLTMSRKCLSGSYPDTSPLQSEMEVIRQIYLFLLSLNSLWKMGRSRSHSSSVGKDTREAVPSKFHGVTKSHKLGQPEDQLCCWQMLGAQRSPENDAGGLDGLWQLKASLLTGQQSHCLYDRALSSLPPHIQPGGCGPTPKPALWQGVNVFIISNAEGLQFWRYLHFLHEGDKKN